MKLKCLASLLFLTTTIISCAQQPNQKNSTDQKMAMDLTVDAVKFSKAITAPDAQILDVRTAGEFQSGHIANALQANWLDPKEFKNRTQHLDKSKTIIDIGANCGLFSIPSSLNGYQVYGFEPIRMNLRLLELGKEENKCDKFKIIPLAVSNKTKKQKYNLKNFQPNIIIKQINNFYRVI